MKQKLKKHSFSIFFSFFWAFIGLGLILAGTLFWFPAFFAGPLKHFAFPLVFGSALSYLVLSLTLARIREHAYGLRIFLVLSLATIVTAVFFIILATFRTYFSLSFLLYIYAVNVLWSSLEILLRLRFAHYDFYVLPNHGQDIHQEYRYISIHELADPHSLPSHADAVVVDFNKKLQNIWLAFISHCILKGVPVISTDDLIETEEGRIILGNLTTASSINFQKETFFQYVKRLFDLIFVFVLAPFWLPIMLIFMLLVRLESSGPVIFTQVRIGLAGKPFRILKIRSMCIDSEKEGAAFAKQEDARITKIGAFIRKFRIDELPQFINILLGHMSLVGPRPEQQAFVDEFEKEIPYYQLRHIVRPGITGWAQINQGYAAGTAETSEKLSYDLYYVKHLSFSMDLLISLKTLATILTGFGSR